ncbi:ArsR family transcriptional regulator [Halopenitus sp. POP-27]|uniref:ArsR/SmtB family transcription factor n=1 Tax=Halopenitus sp. POP-27 TaxID=2994425 RepID=UPI002468A129|nr:ArsR family transcriptional regulator [Halopenitus sp. POP-27]
MDSAVLLDLLGNENRRRILRLLSKKSCYVTEISEYLGVSPKAVIDHLRKLEEAGLIESTTDEKRRKYFHISRSLRLEVNVSPYGFGAKSAYPASPGLDMSGRCPHLSIEIDPTEPAASEDGATDPTTIEESADLADLAMEYDRLRDLDRELSLAQRWVHGRIEAVLSRIDDRFGLDADSQFYVEVIAAVIETDGTPEAVASEVGTSTDVIDDVLSRLHGAGLLSRDGDRFSVR